MLLHWIWLATRQGVSERTKYELVQRYGDPEAVFLEQGYRECPGITPKALEALNNKSLEEARHILEQCRRLEIRLLTLQDAAYPRRLRGIYDPPILLYYRGQLPAWEERPLIGAVGTRQCSPAGRDAGRQMGYQLSRCGGGVVSGMAEGIDAAVLSGALLAQGQVTVILAGGVDVVYPRENRWLYDQVLSRGCILSEYPPGTQHLRWHFRLRNRLISGISNGVLVVEAPEKSGALITARHALDQGRDVFAVPCAIRLASGKGSNALLKNGAAVAETGWDILQQYEAQYPGLVCCEEDCPPENSPQRPLPEPRKKPPEQEKKSPPRKRVDKKVIDNREKTLYIDVEKKPPTRTPAEQAIIDQLRAGPRLTDGVINGCALPYGEVLAAMTMLEIQGVVKRLPGNMLALNES